MLSQFWLIKHWIPFFIQKQKRRLIFLRVYLLDSLWYLAIISSSSPFSSKERIGIFSSTYYICILIIIVGCGVWYLVQGGYDHLVKYRFHYNRNIFALFAICGGIMSIVGLIIGDGGGNNLVDTLDYHSAFVMTYVGIELTIAMIVHHFIVVYEELAWDHPNPLLEDMISSPSMLISSKSNVEATNGNASTSNKVACDNMYATSNFIEFANNMGNVAVPPPINKNKMTDTVDDIKLSNDKRGVASMTKEDGKEVEDLEAAQWSATIGDEKTCDDHHLHALSIPYVAAAALSENHVEYTLNITERTNDVEMLMADVKAAHGLVSSSTTVPFADAPPSMIHPPTRTPVRSRAGSIVIFYQRRVALAFDGITRRGSILRRNILTHEIMMVKLKRHELVCIEIDKLFCVVYQLLLWETLMWLAQIFLGLYLRSVNTPTLPATQDGYYCQTPLENTINSAQFVNDLVFARR